MATPSVVPAVPANDDPFLRNDDGLGVFVDFRDSGHEGLLQEIARRGEEEEEEFPQSGDLEQPETEIPAAEPQPEVPAQPEPAAEPQPEPEADQPTVYNYEDGSSVIVEKSNKGWKATLDSGVRGMKKEVFYGKTKDELFSNVAVGKINATRKIRELNQRSRQTAPAPQAAPAAEPQRELSADESFQLKTMFASNPGEAIDFFLKKQTGHTASELGQLARDGKTARLEVDSETVARQFIANNPEYYADPESQNYETLLAWLSRHKLHTPYLGVQDTMTALVEGGFWTSNSLQEAYETLSEDGLLLEQPTAEEQPAPARVAAPAPTPAPNSRIASTRTVKRAAPANQGLHNQDTHGLPALPSASRAPSADELEALSDKEIADLFSGVVRHNAQQKAPRRNV